MVVVMMRWRWIAAAAATGRRIRNRRNGGKAEYDRQEEHQLAHKGFLISGGRIEKARLLGSVSGTHSEGNPGVWLATA
jgi:hypothetical protein